MHVRVKFFDGRRDARDTAGHPFEGQPHSGFRRAKCPHLVDIREGQAARSRTDLPGSDEGYGSAGGRRSGHPALPTGSAPSSEAHTNCQQRFVLPARRYEARSLSLAGPGGTYAVALTAPALFTVLLRRDHCTDRRCCTDRAPAASPPTGWLLSSPGVAAVGMKSRARPLGGRSVRRRCLNKAAGRRQRCCSIKAGGRRGPTRCLGSRPGSAAPYWFRSGTDVCRRRQTASITAWVAIVTRAAVAAAQNGAVPRSNPTANTRTNKGMLNCNSNRCGIFGCRPSEFDPASASRLRNPAHVFNWKAHNYMLVGTAPLGYTHRRWHTRDAAASAGQFGSRRTNTRADTNAGRISGGGQRPPPRHLRDRAPAGCHSAITDRSEALLFRGRRSRC